MSPHLTTLPYEIIVAIILNLNLNDIIALAETCRQLQYLQQEKNICRLIMETKIPFSKEAITTKASRQDYASVIRRVAGRRSAFANAAPYSIAIVGLGDSYIYCNGVLCYNSASEVRVLDLYNSASEETVFGLSNFLLEFFPDYDSKISIARLKLLNCNENILCFLLRISQSEISDQLLIIAINTKTRALLFNELVESTEKIFVRYNDEFLFYGTYSKYDDNMNKRWVIRGYRFNDQGHLFVLSFMMDFSMPYPVRPYDQLEEVDWTSFYHCFRFPLDSPSNALLESTDNNRMWRRQHSEGPIDDRWTSLRLDCDEGSHNLRIVEARREWLNGSSKSQRTFYITPIEFSYTSELCNSESEQSSLSDILYDPLLATLTSSDNPHYMKPISRSPENVHPDDDSQFAFVSNKIKACYYNTSANAYLDLVDDPALPHQKQCLRLRIGHRKQLPDSLLPSKPLNQEIDHSNYKHRPIKMWPPDTPNFDKLYTLLNPPSYLGNVQGTADERSVIYCTGGNSDQPAAIIFINFDPDIKLEYQEKVKDKDEEMSTLGVEFDRSSGYLPAGSTGWIWTEQALYKTIGQGFRLR